MAYAPVVQRDRCELAGGKTVSSVVVERWGNHLRRAEHRRLAAAGGSLPRSRGLRPILSPGMDSFGLMLQWSRGAEGSPSNSPISTMRCVENSFGGDFVRRPCPPLRRRSIQMMSRNDVKAMRKRLASSTILIASAQSIVSWIARIASTINPAVVRIRPCPRRTSASRRNTLFSSDATCQRRVSANARPAASPRPYKASNLARSVTARARCRKFRCRPW
jgi:hypothetical protein